MVVERTSKTTKMLSSFLFFGDLIYKYINPQKVKITYGGFFIFLAVPVILGLTTGNAFTATTSNVVKARVQDNYDGSQVLLGHMPSEVSTSIKLSHADPGKILDLRIVLPLQNQDQLTTLLKSIYDPKSPNFHHYLTPDQFAQQFSPSEIDTIAVENSLKSQGLSNISQSPNGFVLKVTGPVSAVEQAFKLHINNYQKSDGTKFYAPDADPTIDVQIAGKISAIAGLNNLVMIKPPLLRINTKSQGASGINTSQGIKLSPGFQGTGPYGFLSPQDITKAYNLNGISSNGSGQTVALYELDGYNPSDISTYLSQFSLPDININNPCNYISSSVYTPINLNNPPNSSCAPNILQNILIDGFSGNPSTTDGQGEVTSDIEILIGIAPGLSNILVYEAPNSWQSWEDQWIQIATDNLAKVISNSWGISELLSPEVSFDQQIFAQLAAQGQEVFTDAGDAGAYDNCDNGTFPPNCTVNGQPAIGVLSVHEPAAEPYVTAVGITVLSLNNGIYSETASPMGGGGISVDEPIPFYQQGMISQASLGSTTMRNVPDVSLTADSSTPYSFYISGQWEGVYGSSISTPIWAAFNAIVNEGRANAGEGPLGFINPALYAIAQSDSYTSDFNDITSGYNCNSAYLNQYPCYPAGTGYDDATGLGSFNGANLYNGLIASNRDIVITSSSGGGGGTVLCGGNTCPTSVNAGTSLTFTATPANGSKFSSWGGACAGVATTTCTITINAATTNVLANFLYITPISPTVTITSPVSGNLLYLEGQNITLPLTATASEDGGVITSVKFYNNNVLIGTGVATDHNIYTYSLSNAVAGSTYTLTAVATDSSGQSVTSSPVTVTISLKYSLSINITGGGTIVCGAYGWNGMVYYACPTSVAAGTSLSFYVGSEPTGYVLSSWGGACAGVGSVYYNSCSITTGASDTTISANFIPSVPQTITASAGPNGSISPNGTVSVNYGSSQTFTVTPNTGYTPSLTVDGLPATLTNNTYTFTYVTGPHTISVSFSLIQTETITASSGANGNISPSGAVLVNSGASQTFTVTPNTGYTPSLTVDGLPATLINNTYTFTNVTGPHTISVSFSLIQTETITASSGANGRISPSGAVLVNSGSSQTFTVTPNSVAYEPILTVDGLPAALTNNTYTFNDVTGPHTISVSFILQPETITASAGPNGSISPAGAVNVNYGSSQTFTFTPDTGYSVYQVLVDNVAVTLSSNNSYTVSNVTSNHTIAVSFIQSYIITASAGSNGSISPSGAVSVDVGASQKFTITANTGYSINEVLVDNVAVTLDPGNTYTISDVTAAHTITASFIPNYTITAISGANGRITPSGAVIVNSGASQTFTVTPNSTTYTAVLTVDGLPATLTNNTYTFNNVRSSHTISVSFSTQIETITASSSANGRITPSGAISVNIGGRKVTLPSRPIQWLLSRY